ncbi:MAG: beta-ketoacyl-[acyl-carrier-protein] synthase family protein [Planctomycetes bacterium]|nr:beta-ketoacyl-[acyl-carrier-protein] synthase family protein [Planctomycetota bacterium]
MPELARIVITGVGLAAPNGNSLAEFRASLLAGRSGVVPYEIRHVGKTLAGVCNFDALRHQSKKELRRGTRAGSIAVYCANEAVRDAGLELRHFDPQRIGVFPGITEHGNVETENEIHEVAKYGFDLSFWSHHHNPRTVANNPAGEVTLNLGLKGPAYCLGGACAAGNLGLIHGAQLLRLGEIDLALGGGVSESIRTFGIFASFASEGALAKHADPSKASRPFDKARNGIVVAEGGCLYALERLEDARKRGARIYAELLGYCVNSDGTDFVLPDAAGQNACIRGALASAKLAPEQIDLVSTHATSTPSGDVIEARVVREVFGDGRKTHVNNTKSFIGHAMGAAGALELAGNLPSLADGVVHPTINLDELDPQCEVPNLVANTPKNVGRVETILNMSFGMLGINSAVVVGRCRA